MTPAVALLALALVLLVIVAAVGYLLWPYEGGFKL